MLPQKPLASCSRADCSGGLGAAELPQDNAPVNSPQKKTEIKVFTSLFMVETHKLGRSS